MTPCVCLVGFEDQDNLGMRYLASALKAQGIGVRLLNFGERLEPLVESIAAHRPVVVGFSLIFQFMVGRFGGLLRCLREAGVRSHFTMGGHYASFEPGPLLQAIPELDSVVRFEGEDALVDLVRAVLAGRPLSAVMGLAFREDPAGGDGVGVPGGGAVRLNARREPRADLDTLPWPERGDIPYEAQDYAMASILGSRGCPWKCSFCSITPFYALNGTSGRRFRHPARVVDEIEHLHRVRGVRILLWQDDDFLGGGAKAQRWALDVAAECVRRGLHRDLRWKISCRSDEVDAAVLGPLREAGLTHVYMGVESGDEESLKHLNKHLKPAKHLEAGRVLRDLELSCDFGFMLMEPWSTFDTIRGNIRFLREFAGDGFAVAGFCRMLPYVGTPAHAQLRAEGRLREPDLQPDYDFLDRRLDAFYAWWLEVFQERNFTSRGTANVLRYLLFESNLDFAEAPKDSAYRRQLKRLAALSNQAAMDALESGLRVFEASEDSADPAALHTIATAHATQDRWIRAAALNALKTHLRAREDRSRSEPWVAMARADDPAGARALLVGV